MEQQNIAVSAIADRSPDLNPIENLFNQVKYQLRPINFCVWNWRCDNKNRSIGLFIFQKSEILCYQFQHDNYIPNWVLLSVFE